MQRLAFAGLLAGATLVFGASPASALLVNFECISNNTTKDCETGENQLQADLTGGPGANQVSFTFTNSGPKDSSITAVYFDDGTLSAIASILDGTGVDFEEGASPPNLPAGNEANPAFEADFAADAEPPTEPNGVNPNETLTIVFDLLMGSTLTDTENALRDGSLRIGLHVQGFKKGGSESFVNVPPGGVVPEPSIGLLLAAPALVALARRRKR